MTPLRFAILAMLASGIVLIDYGHGLVSTAVAISLMIIGGVMILVDVSNNSH